MPAWTTPTLTVVPDGVVVQRVQRQDLVGELLRRADAFLGLDAGVRGAAGDAHEVVAGALARGLERAARERRFQHVGHRRAVGGLPRSARRDVGLPTSSSEVNRTCSRRRGRRPRARSACSAKYSTTMPPFMSKQPGPRATPCASTLNGIRSSVPVDQTVS